jgi:hypothetical protein
MRRSSSASQMTIPVAGLWRETGGFMPVDSTRQGAEREGERGRGYGLNQNPSSTLSLRMGSLIIARTFAKLMTYKLVVFIARSLDLLG